jgi:RHS repeat-associated protein
VQRISQSDALGKLVSVCEVSSTTQLGTGSTPAACGLDISATGFLTTYQYDALGNLLNVNQNGLTQRAFTYDSLSRLLTAANPESGTTTYTYDNNSNVLTKKDARNITITYAYDPLNRLAAKTYSDSTPSANFGYDDPNAWGRTLTNTVGRMVTNSTTNFSGEVFSYDPMGRVIRDEQCISVGFNGCMTTLATYNFDSSVKTLTTSPQFTYAYDGAGRLSSVTSSLSDANHPGTLISGFQYNPLGRPVLDTLGNGITDHFDYTNRGWIDSYWACTVPGSTCSSPQLVYTFNMTTSLGALGYAPNGNILVSNDLVNGNWTYSYDAFNRLSSSSCSASICPGSQSALGFQYKFDRFGNRWQQNLTAGSGAAPSYAFDANNRLVGSPFQYDAAGNLINDGSHTYAYDAENRVTSVGGGAASYTYDAQGRRISKTTAGGATSYFYDALGNQAFLVNPSGSVIRTEIYAGGRHLGTYTNGTTYFSFVDWLGTERVRTDVNKTTVESCQNAPYGDMQSCTNTDLTPLHFTGKERDAESNLDNLGARYYSSAQARFMTADWAGSPTAVPYAEFGNPQSLNLYSYVKNNPLSFADPDGHCCWDWITNKVSQYIHPADSAQVAMGMGKQMLNNGLGTNLKPSNGMQQAGADFLTNQLGPAIVVGAVITGAVEGVAPESLPNDAVVVRGGLNTPENFTNGRGVTTDASGNLQGVSVNSAPGKSTAELSQGIKNSQVGVTTAGEVRNAGGEVKPSPTLNNPNHCTMCGVTAEKASSLMKVIPNPANPPKP